MFQGADAEALEALAGQMGEAADGLERVGQTLRASLYAAPWSGSDADFFRQEWDGPHRVRLSGAAASLRTVADVLRANAADQRVTSESDGGMLAAAGLPVAAGVAVGGYLGAALDMGYLGTALDGVFGAGSALTGALAGLLSAGTLPGSFEFWSRVSEAGQLGFELLDGGVDVAEAFGARLGGFGKLVSAGGFIIGVASSASEQTLEDYGSYGAVEQVFRSSAAGIAGGLVSTGVSVGIPALLGTAICPVVGTAAGVAIGIGVNYALEEWGVADKVTDAGAWVGSRLYDGAVDAVEFGGDVLDLGRDVWDARDEIADEARDLGSGLVAAGSGALEDAIGFVDGIRAPWD